MLLSGRGCHSMRNACCLKTNTCCVSPRRHNGMVWKLWRLLTPSCFKQKTLVFALTLRITFLRYCHKRKKKKKEPCLYTTEKLSQSMLSFPLRHESGCCIPQLGRKCAFLPLFLFNVPSITTSAGWEHFFFFFSSLWPCLWCLSAVWHPRPDNETVREE